MPRLTICTPEIVEAICERLEDGAALATVCRDGGMPSVSAFLRAVAQNEQFEEMYRVALQARAEWFNAEHDRIRKTAIDRDSAAAAKVQLTGLEWQMSKMAPSKYGDRVSMTVDHTFDLAAALDKGRQRVLEGNAKLGLPGPDESRP